MKSVGEDTFYIKSTTAHTHNHRADFRPHSCASAGDDGVTSEMLQALDQLGVTQVAELCSKISDTGHIPEDLKKSTFLPIPKKSEAGSCSDYRSR